MLPLNSGKKYKTKPKLITYNNQSQQIEFDNLSPLSLRNTDNQALLCKVLFKSKKPLVTEQILEKWGWSRARIYNDENKLDKRNRLVVYHAARDINEKINKHTHGTVSTLILYTTKAAQINPDLKNIVS